MVRVLISGGTGTVARRLASILIEKNYDILLATRRLGETLPAPAIQVGNIDGKTDWKDALNQIDVVIHLAAQTTDAEASKEASLSKFLSVNRDGTECLARAAVASRVRRFIYLSSILAVGDHTNGDAVFLDDSQPKENDGYGISKRRAEESLLAVAEGTPMEVVILRPPPIYGPNMTNKILMMFKAVRNNWPLPVKTVENHLSFIYIDNLVSAINISIDHPNAVNRKYFICDQENVSTPQFLTKIALAMGKKERLFPFPVVMLRLMGLLTGQQFAVGRLINSLNVDGSDFCRELNWKPPMSMDAGLKVSAEWYLSTYRK